MEYVNDQIRRQDRLFAILSFFYFFLAIFNIIDLRKNVVFLNIFRLYFRFFSRKAQLLPTKIDYYTFSNTYIDKSEKMLLL